MMFSIVIPVYGTERFLPRCLDSLARQTCADFEVVVVDDASPAPEAGGGVSCAGIVARYDGRFRCVRHGWNRSAFQARRTGVRGAKGDYVVPVDPDDYLLPETLGRLRETIGREDPDLLSYRMEYDDGGKIRPHWCRHPSATVTGLGALRELTEHRYFTGVASKAFRRETLLAALEELAAPEDLYVNTSDDFLMLVPMLVKCRRVSFVDFAGYRYGVNAGSTSFSWKTAEGFRRACEQTHRAGGLVLDCVRKAGAPDEAGKLVETAVADIERWFVRMAAAEPVERWEALAPVLLETLSPAAVAAELAGEYARLRRTRACRAGRALGGILRMFSPR